MAMLYKSQRQFHKAADSCRHALEVRLRSTAADSAALVPYYLALATLQLAQLPARPTNGSDRAGEELDEAQQNVKLARAVSERNKLMDRPQAATLLQLEGTIHQRQGNEELARKDSRTALAIAKASRQTVLQAKSLNYLAASELNGGELKTAEELTREALDLRIEAYPNLRFLSYLNRAQVLRALGRGSEALDALKLAIEQIEAPRSATVGAESERAEFFSQFAAAFDLLVDWNVQDGRYREALAASETGRNRTFRDQVRAAGVDVRDSLKGTPAELLLNQERDILQRYNEQLNRLRRAEPAEVHAAAEELESWRRKHAQIQTEIRDASPYYRNLLGTHQADDDWSSIEPHVLTSDNVLLLYYLGSAKSHLFIVDGRTRDIEQFSLAFAPETAKLFGIEPGPLTRGVAAQLISAYLEFLRADRAQPKRSVATQAVTGEGTLARSISKQAASTKHHLALTEVFLPAAARERLLKSNPSHLVVVPDGALHQLPLEALLMEDEPRRYVFDVLPAIAYAPSATILSILKLRGARQAGQGVSLLTVGDPRYLQAGSSEGRSLGADYLALGGRLSPLPGTREECEQVVHALRSCGATDVRALYDREASETNVRELIHNRRFVHLAAHGLVDQQHENLFGAIALATERDAKSSEEDGFLSLYEIYALNLSGCDLVVLSACETNVGADRPLEAGSTLARAFLAAAAARVIASHWSVDDKSTATLIGTFFARVAKDLDEGRSPDYALALQAARRQVRDNPQWASPYYWAPFVLIGPEN